MLEVKAEGWFVSPTCDLKGTILFEVVHKSDPEKRSALTLFVKHYPKWMFWFKPFSERVHIVSDIAQQRAWELNQQAIKARQQIYEIEVASRRNNE
jgi:hypothetical protein